MQPHRDNEKREILATMDRYLAGEITANEASGWATLKMTGKRDSQESREMDDHIIADALGCLMMLSESEPEEYRTTREDLLQSRSYLSGQVPFPLERIPKRR